MSTEPLDRTVVIAADRLRKTYSGIVAVDDLSFTVAAGEVIGLLGPNGAGKTSTINMLTTLLPIDGGVATVGGCDVATQPRAVRTKIGLAGQAAAVDEMLTARENLKLFGRLYKIPKNELLPLIDKIIERFRMSDYADRPVSTLSGGQRRRLDIVVALVGSPPALFLDEPTTGLDPRTRNELWETIEDLAADGTAVLLTTQYLEEADRLADHIVMIDNGQVVARGTPRQLKAQLEREVLEVHLASESDLANALRLVGDVPGVQVDPASKELHVPIEDGAGTSLQILRRLDDAGIRIADFQLRQPTLDDVFLTLTGAETDQGGAL